MTDNEIIKALDGADVFLRDRARSKPSPLNEYDIALLLDIAKTCDEAATIINRQKAEIERLTYYNENLLCANSDILGRHEHYIKEAKAEAIKEFVERLKTYPIDCNLPLLGLETKQEIEAYFNSVMKQIDNAIDNLAKEMTEETKHE